MVHTWCKIAVDASCFDPHADQVESTAVYAILGFPPIDPVEAMDSFSAADLL